MQAAMSIHEWLDQQMSSEVAGGFGARMPIPPAYDRFASLDFEALRARDRVARWSDFCPAYAFALLTRSTHAALAPADVDGELRARWEQMRGASELDWSAASIVVRGAWRYLESA